MKYLRDKILSPEAEELVQFDADSILHVAKAERSPAPDTWITDPDEYEKNGRLRRDSPSPRMLAYSRNSQTLYATDGCNSCVRKLPAAIERLSEEELASFARDHELRLELLKSLIAETSI